MANDFAKDSRVVATAGHTAGLDFVAGPCYTWRPRERGGFRGVCCASEVGLKI
jgi:hypothetical protein